MQIYKNRDTKAWETSTFSSAGAGISIQHFVQANGIPVEDYGFTALVMFDVSGATQTVSPALTVTALQYINAGIGYNPKLKVPFLMLGINYSFNK
jgi:hypothetical protein